MSKTPDMAQVWFYGYINHRYTQNNGGWLKNQSYREVLGQFREDVQDLGKSSKIHIFL
jgi:hypothetical protein